MRRHAPYALGLLLVVAAAAFGGGSIVGYSVIATPLNFGVAVGDVPGSLHINKFGHNDDVDTGTVPETAWTQGGIWAAPTAARTHQIVSADTDDSSSGTGARTIRIYGLDASWNAQTEDITMNGTTNVGTASTYTRIFRMAVLTAGSSMFNEGLITATADTDATITAAIEAQISITHMAVWTIPTGYTFYATDAFASIDRQGATQGAMAEFEFCVISGIDGATPVGTVVQTFALAVDGTSAINYKWVTPKVIPGPADVFIRVNYVSKDNTSVSCGFGGVYIAN